MSRAIVIKAKEEKERKAGLEPLSFNAKNTILMCCSIGLVALVMMIAAILGFGGGQGVRASGQGDITITSVEQLRNIGNETYEVSGKKFLKNATYRLGANLTITPEMNYVPTCVSGTVGAPDGPFTGKLDGNGYVITISGTITATGNCFGIIGRTGVAASIVNVTVNFESGAKIAGNYSQLGAIVGYAGQATRFDNCNVTGDGTVQALYDSVGGIVGQTESGAAFFNCSSSVIVKGRNNVGGIGGYSGNYALVKSCIATGNVFASGDYVGGIVGRMSGHSELRDSGATGDISFSGSYAGGTVGFAPANFSNYTSYASGNVISDGTKNSLYVGGFAGYVLSNSSYNCYATGNVQGFSYVGGFVGYLGRGTANDCSATGNVVSTGTGTSATDGNAGIAGGFFGALTTDRANSNASIYRSMATGTVSNTATSGTVVLGGFVGKILDQKRTNAAGVVTIEIILFDRCVSATGVITTNGATAVVGGFVGYRDTSHMTINNYSRFNAGLQHNGAAVTVGVGAENTAESTIINPTLLTAVSDADLRLQATYEGWATANWTFVAGQYPVIINKASTGASGGATHTIYTAQQLADIGSGNVHNGAAYGLVDNYILGQDITISGAWSPFTKGSSVFMGSFDGAGHTVFIDGTVTASGSNFGIIGNMNYARVENLNVHYNEGAVIDANAVTGYVGTVVGYANRGCVLMNVNVTGNGRLVSKVRTGGIMGAAVMNPYISNVTCALDVESTGNEVGGLIGYSSSPTIEYSWYKGNVTGKDRVGGLIANYAGGGSVKKSYVVGNVTGESRVGGFLGSVMWGGLTIEDCYVIGDVTSTGNHGGVANSVSGSAGGFIGATETVNDQLVKTYFRRCYFEGRVINTSTTHGANLGGVIGMVTASGTGDTTIVVENCAVLVSDFITNDVNDNSNVGIVFGHRYGSGTFSSGTKTFYRSDVKHNGALLDDIAGLEYTNSGSGVKPVSTNFNLCTPRSFEDFVSDTTWVALGFNFASVWKMGTLNDGGAINEGLPVFRYEHPDIAGSVWLQFDTAGGSYMPEIAIEPGAVSFSMPAAPVLSGWVFDGFYSSTLGNGTLMIDKNMNMQGLTSKLLVSISADTVIIYAKWIAVVEFSVMGDTDTSRARNITITKGVATNFPTALVGGAPSGWDFAAADWFDSTANAYKTSGTAGRVTGFDAGYTAGAATLYARLTCSVSFNVDGGTSVTSVPRVWGAVTNLPVSATNGSWDFLGWFRVGSVEEARVTSDSAVSSIPAGDTKGAETIYSRWRGEVSYSVQGSVIGTKTTFIKGVGADLEQSAAVSSGWVFNDWRRTNTVGSVISAVASAESVAKFTVFANVTKSVSYNFNGVSSGVASATLTYGASYSLEAPSNSAYSFGGWFDNSGLSGGAVAQTGTWTRTDDIPGLWAKWTLALGRSALDGVVSQAGRVVPSIIVSAPVELSAAQTLVGYFNSGDKAELQLLAQADVDSVAQNLRSVLFGEMKTKIQALVYATALFDAADYSSVTWGAHSLQKDIAETGLGGGWVDTSTEDISVMIDNFVAFDAANTALINVRALVTAVSNAMDKIDEHVASIKYTDASLDVLSGALNGLSSAEGFASVYAISGKSQGEVDSWVAEIDSASGDLVLLALVEWAELQTSIELCDSLVEMEFTSATWTALDNALVAAVALTNQEGASVLVSARDALESAFSVLINIVQLRDALLGAEAKTQADYTVATWAAVSATVGSLTSGNVRDDFSGTSTAAADSVADSINTAVAGLKLQALEDMEVALADLIVALGVVAALDEDGYTNESWADLQSVLSSYEEIITAVADNYTAQQFLDNGKYASDLTDVTDSINQAVGLLEVPDALKYAALEALRNHGLDGNDYTSQTWTAFLNGIGSHSAHNEHTDAALLQSAIDEITALRNALVSVVALRSALAHGKVEGEHTVASWSVLDYAIAQVPADVRDITDNQSVVDAKTQAILDAVGALVNISELEDALVEFEALDYDLYDAVNLDILKSLVGTLNSTNVREDFVGTTVSANQLSGEIRVAIDALVTRDIANAQIHALLVTARDFTLVDSDYSSSSWSNWVAVRDANDVTVWATPAEITSATAAVNEAKAALVNVTGLRAVLEFYEGEAAADYSGASWDALVTQVGAYEASSVRGFVGSQAELDAIVSNIQSAIDSLVTIENSNALVYAALEAARDFSGLQENHYSISSFDALLEARRGVEGVTDREQDQAVIIDATNAINSAKAALVDVRALQTKLDEANQKSKDAKYSAATRNALASVINGVTNARAFEGNQGAVNSFVSQLDVAISNLMLQSTVDKMNMLLAQLATLVNSVNSLQEYDYTVASWDNFENAISTALSYNFTINSSEDLLAATIVNVDIAKNALVNISALRNIIQTANEKIAELSYVTDFTLVSRSALEAAIGVHTVDNIRELTENQSVIDGYTATINNALVGLVGIKALKDKVAAIKEQIGFVDSVEEVANNYTTETVNALGVQMQRVTPALLERGLQSEVDSIYQEIIAAHEALVSVQVGQDNLKALILVAESIVFNDYTIESWENLNTAIENASAAALNGSRQQVSATLAYLKLAIGSLEDEEYFIISIEDLQSLYDAYSGENAIDPNNYTYMTYESFNSALAMALLVINNKNNIGARTIQDTYFLLAGAIESLVVEKGALINLVLTVKNYRDEHFIDMLSYAQFLIALDAANNVLAKSDISLVLYNQALNKLIISLDNLDPAYFVTMEMLTERINDINNIQEDFDFYSKVSIAAVNAAFIYATEIQAQGLDARKASLLAAYSWIEAATNSLAPDAWYLKELLNIDSTLYTFESYREWVASTKDIQTYISGADLDVEILKGYVTSIVNYNNLLEANVPDGTDEESPIYVAKREARLELSVWEQEIEKREVYTEESFEVYAEAVERLISLFNSKSASSAQVANAIEDVRNAKAGLTILGSSAENPSDDLSTVAIVAGCIVVLMVLSVGWVIAPSRRKKR